MSETPLGHDRTAAAHNSSSSLRSHRYERQTYAGVDGEVVDALLGLFNQSVAEDFPRQLFRFAANFFQSLIDWHSANWHWRVAQDPLARGVNVLSRRKIHHGV